ncbi:MAG: SMP-30/gluconolactonase/LRE family protein, partial [Verrucomicrobiota bacterium]
MLLRLASLSLALRYLIALSIFGLAGSFLFGEDLKIEGRVAFVEGPAWRTDGNVFFTDIENNRIMRRDPSGKVQVFRHPSGRANGLAFDAEGRLIACEGHREGGNRRVTRTEKDGSITILTDSYDGKRFNSPNDLVIDEKGRIYFTDPPYGLPERASDPRRELDFCGVYRL